MTSERVTSVLKTYLLEVIVSVWLTGLSATHYQLSDSINTLKVRISLVEQTNKQLSDIKSSVKTIEDNTVDFKVDFAETKKDIEFLKKTISER